MNAASLGLLAELRAELVLADAANVAGGRRLSEHPLRHPDRVLAGTTGNVLDFEVLHNLGVDRHVLLLGEDLVVGVEAILGEVFRGDRARDVEQRVANAKN